MPLIYVLSERRHCMRQSDFSRMAASVLGVLACIGILYIIGKSMVGEWKYESQETLQKYTEEMYMPGLAYMKEGPGPTAAEWIKERAYSWLPLVKYVEQKEPYESAMEDEETIAKILAAQANDENMVDENGNLVGDGTPAQEEPAIQQGQSPIDMSIEKLRDFNYLTSNFYTIDSTTMIGPEQLNVDYRW